MVVKDNDVWSGVVVSGWLWRVMTVQGCGEVWKKSRCFNATPKDVKDSVKMRREDHVSLLMLVNF